jgi:diadenylate cyclase
LAANLFWILSRINLSSLLDIVLVAAVIYGALRLLQGTQAVQLLRGAIILAILIALVGSISQLTAFSWLLRSGGQALLVIVAIVLQPELRRALDRVGRAGTSWFPWTNREGHNEQVVRNLALACERLSAQRHGALIVIERETGLQDRIEQGVQLDSSVEAELLQTIFFPKTPLHDGAVVIRGARIVAAAVVLPLAEAIVSDTHLGTRHRAAVGITEQTDAIAVVVSEETGIISVARNGRIVRHLDARSLSNLLMALLSSSGEQRRQRRATSGRPSDAS